MKELTTEYIAGFLDNIGCFYAMKAQGRKYKTPQFKIVVQKTLTKKFDLLDKITYFLDVHHNIKFSFWEHDKQGTWQITNTVSLIALLKFLNENCYLDKNNQLEIKCIIENKQIDAIKREKEKEIKK